MTEDGFEAESVALSLGVELWLNIIYFIFTWKSRLLFWMVFPRFPLYGLFFCMCLLAWEGNIVY